MKMSSLRKVALTTFVLLTFTASYVSVLALASNDADGEPSSSFSLTDIQQRFLLIERPAVKEPVDPFTRGLYLERKFDEIGKQLRMERERQAQIEAEEEQKRLAEARKLAKEQERIAHEAAKKANVATASVEVSGGISMGVHPEGTEKTTWMQYTKITSKSSAQYKLQQKGIQTSPSGIMMQDGRYLGALGSFYSDRIGQDFIIVFSSGIRLPFRTADFKADAHTDPTNRIAGGGDTVEFLIEHDLAVFESKNPRARILGSFHESFGKVIDVIKLN